MYTFFKTEERYAVERRKLPAFCRVKKAAAESKKGCRGTKSRRGKIFPRRAILRYWIFVRSQPYNCLNRLKTNPF